MLTRPVVEPLAVLSSFGSPAVVAPALVQLRRETLGDPGASAMAVLAQGEAMRRIAGGEPDLDRGGGPFGDAGERVARAQQPEGGLNDLPRGHRSVFHASFPPRTGCAVG